MIVDVIKKQWERQKTHLYYESYFAIDLHGTVIRPDHLRISDSIEFYPYAKEVMQILTKRYDIRTICFTSSYPDEIIKYTKLLKEAGIEFNYIHDNPEISEANGAFGYYKYKPYFDVMIEDKAGFNPEIEWKQIYDLLTSEENFIPNIEWKNQRLP